LQAIVEIRHPDSAASVRDDRILAVIEARQKNKWVRPRASTARAHFDDLIGP
jgi:hypothetical protein